MIKKIFFFFLLNLTIGCNDKKTDKPVKNILPKSIEINKQSQEIKYVTAKSGLIFRNKPKGKKLGKFEFNEKIVINKHTGIFQEIKSESKIIKGEWLSVKLENNIVYVFDGYLSDTKTQITIADIKLFMGDFIWISEEFKNILEETKVLSKAYNCVFYSDIAYDDYLFKQATLFGDKNFMEPNSMKININLCGTDFDGKIFKISDINNKTLIIEKENKQYIFTKSNIQKNPYYIVGGIDTASSDFFINWFGKSSFVFKNENGTKNYNSKNVNYWLDGDIIEIEKMTYSIDSVKNDTYFLSEIKVVWEDEIDFSTSKTGKKATLRKTKPTTGNKSYN